MANDKISNMGTATLGNLSTKLTSAFEITNDLLGIPTTRKATLDVVSQWLCQTGGLNSQPIALGAITAVGAATFSSTVAITGAVTSGTINGQTISATAALTGTLSVAGAVTGSSTITGTNFFAGAGNSFAWSGRSQFTSETNGTITLFNAAQSDFTRLNFGGTTSSFPALNRSGTTLTVQLADGTAGGNLSIGGTLSVAGLVTATGGAIITGIASGNSCVIIGSSGAAGATDLTYNNPSTANLGANFTINSGGTQIAQLARVGRVDGGTSDAIYFRTTTAAALMLGTNSATNLTIASGGAISMSSTLSVAGATNVAAAITVTGASGGFQINRRDTNVLSWTVYSAGGNLDFYDNIGGINRVAITPAGNISTQGTLSVAGAVAVGGATVSASTGLITPTGTTALSSLRIPHGAAPTSPVDGDVWSTTTTLNFRLNGVTKSVTLV